MPSWCSPSIPRYAPRLELATSRLTAAPLHGVRHEVAIGAPSSQGGFAAFQPVAIAFDSRRGALLNRPSTVSVCKHGFMHVSSFISSETGSRRRIYKFGTGSTCLSGSTDIRVAPSASDFAVSCEQAVGWLDSRVEDGGRLLASPWGVSCARDGSVYATVHAAAETSPSTTPSVVKLASCGCAEYGQVLRKNPPPHATGTVAQGRYPANTRHGPWVYSTHGVWIPNCANEPEPFWCGAVTSLTTSLDQPNYVMAL